MYFDQVEGKEGKNNQDGLVVSTWSSGPEPICTYAEPWTPKLEYLGSHGVTNRLNKRGQFLGCVLKLEFSEGNMSGHLLNIHSYVYIIFLFSVTLPYV